jgi:hypothetical protein
VIPFLLGAVVAVVAMVCVNIIMIGFGIRERRMK